MYQARVKLKSTQSPPEHEVLVYRESWGWNQYTLVRVHDNEVDVILPSGRISSFPINMVPSFHH